MNTFLSLFRICSDKFKIKGFSALKFTRVIIPEYTLPVSCSKPNQRSSLKFISYLQNLYFEFLVLLSNLEKIKSLSLSLLESGESFKKFLFLLSNLEKWNPFLFLFSKLENIFSNFSFSSRLDFLASRHTPFQALTGSGFSILGRVLNSIVELALANMNDVY